MAKECVLYSRECFDCGECECCDLDGSKVCTSCGKCIGSEEEYRTLDVADFFSSKTAVKSKYKAKSSNRKNKDNIRLENNSW